MISKIEEEKDKMKYLEWAGYRFNISTGDWVKGQKIITAHDFWFKNVEWIENEIKKGKINNAKNNKV